LLIAISCRGLDDPECQNNVTDAVKGNCYADVLGRYTAPPPKLRLNYGVIEPKQFDIVAACGDVSI